MKKTIVAIVILSLATEVQRSVAQTARPDDGVGRVHRLPFCSLGNSIELTVENTSAAAVQNATVRVSNIPSWLQFVARECTIKEIAAGKEGLALFTFSVDKSAPVGQNRTLTFAVSAPSGQNWMKEITIAVAAPERFELFQNYPNPFSAKGGSASGGNPTTTINYQLPAKSRVSLKIFNVLGQEVATLFDGQKEAGYHQEIWRTESASSGMYVSQIVASDDQGNRCVARRTMLLLK